MITLIKIASRDYNKMDVSTKIANIVSIGIGLFIFFGACGVLTFMTIEYNKGKDYDALKDLYVEQSKILNQTLEEQEKLYESCFDCKFPFKFEGKTYTDCLQNGHETWCPTELDASGTYTVGQQQSNCPVSNCSQGIASVTRLRDFLNKGSVE